MKLDNVLVSVDDHVASITLNRPDKRNSIRPELVADLFTALDWLESQVEVRCLVIDAVGPAFCAGADLKDFSEEWVERAARPSGEAIRGLLEMMTALSDLVHRLRGISYPVIAAVNGPAMGGGCNLALACDIRLATPSARFASSFVKIGLSSAAMGGTYLLPRAIGEGRALELLLTGRDVTAEEADRIGLVNRVVPDEDLADEVRSLAAECAALPPLALAATKRATRLNATATLEQTLALEAQLQAPLFLSSDHQEGMLAFLEKRRPAFEGR
ncbi:enoyl-CoA hydratase/isomerase family protein [Candidatus Poriferisodalis sp.]|uniref:enoyl-CoA hydratase/isomerase family protein n=1 Tax=Candidatus Poriferisodalis sp. TaxID=3101277 RepID=UPI003C6EFA88